MQPKLILSAAAGLVMVASAAFAQTTPAAPAPAAQGPLQHPVLRMGGHWDPADMQKHLAQMCQDRYAKAVGHLAELETKLNLAGKQKPLFDRWKDSILSAAKARVADCQAFKMPDREASIVDHVKMHEKMLQARLDIIKAQMPALEALNASLNEDQQKIFKRDAMEVMMERRGDMMHHMRFEGMRGNHMPMMDGRGDRAMPPPAPAN